MCIVGFRGQQEYLMWDTIRCCENVRVSLFLLSCLWVLVDIWTFKSQAAKDLKEGFRVNISMVKLSRFQASPMNKQLYNLVIWRKQLYPIYVKQRPHVFLVNIHYCCSIKLQYLPVFLTTYLICMLSTLTGSSVSDIHSSSNLNLLIIYWEYSLM